MSNYTYDKEIYQLSSDVESSVGSTNGEGGKSCPHPAIALALTLALALALALATSPSPSP